MEGGSEFRRWDELIPDTLGIIFGNLSLKEVLTVIPRVCKSWNKAVAGPYCWQEIDIEDWSNRCLDNGYAERMLQMLLNRSSGSLRKLCVVGLRDGAIFSSIAEKACSLQTLRLTRCEMSDSTLEHIAAKLSSITFLDLSSCGKIGSRALEAIGKHCKSLVGLCRNMHPIETAGKPPQDDEAHAIAKTMPRIKHLEMAYNLISTGSVLDILTSCHELEFLDLRGCWDVKLDSKYLADKFPKLKVLGPEPDVSEFDWDDSDYSDDASEYLGWAFSADEMEDYYEDEIYDGMWDDEGRLEELELRFYEGIHQDEAPYGWPPSP